MRLVPQHTIVICVWSYKNKNFTMMRMVPQYVKIVILMTHMVLQYTYMLRMVPQHEASAQELL